MASPPNNMYAAAYPGLTDNQPAYPGWPGQSTQGYPQQQQGPQQHQPHSPSHWNGSEQYPPQSQQGWHSQPFMPGVATDYGNQTGYNNHTQTAGPYGQQGPPADAFAIPGLNAPAMSPLNMLAAGSNILSGGGQTWGSRMQQVQKRMGWLYGGALNYHFAINNQYVRNKLFILLTPFLRKWSFTRQTDTLQVQGGHRYRPPCVDVNAPDLYIPMVSAWLYVTLLCGNALLLGRYKPDIVYTKAWWTGFAWAVHAGIAWMLLRMMSPPASLPWGDLWAYTGYVFVPATYTIILGMLGGHWAWWAGWAYGSWCSAVFLVRTIKRVIFQEARYGPAKLTNYLLLALAALQFPLLWWLCYTQLPTWQWPSSSAHSGHAAGSPSLLGGTSPLPASSGPSPSGGSRAIGKS